MRSRTSPGSPRWSRDASSTWWWSCISSRAAGRCSPATPSARRRSTTPSSTSSESWRSGWRTRCCATAASPRPSPAKTCCARTGSGPFIFGMGTEVRVAELPTAQGQSAPVANELRVLTPVSVEAGYRYKLHSWGFDAFGRVGIGTEQTGANENDLGGHVDYSWSLSAGLHFLRYLDAPGINSLYFGGGAAFELAFFEVIQPVATYGTTNSRATLVGGGLNVDLFVGYEFLRASSIHFFGQIEIDAPTYLLKTENDAGAINTYMPGALAQIGIIF